MDLEQEVTQLCQRVARLERQIAFLMRALDLDYQDQPDLVSPEIVALARQGKQIAAIKLYREATGATLRAAKEFIDSLVWVVSLDN